MTDDNDSSAQPYEVSAIISPGEETDQRGYITGPKSQSRDTMEVGVKPR